MTPAAAQKRAASRVRRYLDDMPPVILHEVRKAHYYSYARAGAPRLPSATTILGAVGGAGGLVRWSRNMARDAFRAAISKYEYDPEVETWEDRIMEIWSESSEASDRYRDAAADLGTRVHAWLESNLVGVPPSDWTARARGQGTEEDVRPHVTAAVTWLAAREYLPVACEHRVLRQDPLAVRAGLLRQSPAYGGTVDLIAVDRHGDTIIVDWKTGRSKSDTHLMQAAAYAAALPAALRVSGAHVVYTGRPSDDPDEDVESEGLSALGIKAYYQKFSMCAAAYHATRKTSGVYDA